MKSKNQYLFYVMLLFVALFALVEIPVHAQSTGPGAMQTSEGISGFLAGYWYVVTATLALLMPVGLILIGAAGLDSGRSWNTALGGLAALGLAAVGYWAFGFALQFGGVGLVYTRPGLLGLVWEWSALPPDWGTGWGMAGLSGWFLAEGARTSDAYALFLAHLPWAMTAAALPVLALRDRAPAIATLILGWLMGAVVYPLAGNWVQGGGWLAALGRNLGLGHGLVDLGGTGTVFLVASGVSLAALLVWLPRKAKRPLTDPELPPVQSPLLAVSGALLLFAGAVGWSWSNPIQAEALGELAVIRGSINVILAGAGGVVFPLLYTWFVAGNSHPLMSARGVAAGVIAGLAAGPFVTPGSAMLIGVLAGASLPFVTFAVDRLIRLSDAAGIIAMTGVPSVIGLLAVGIWADGSVGSGWQLAGIDSYLGIAGQGVSGLLVASGYQVDFPGQIQAQVIGVVALALWGFVLGTIVCVPLSVIFQGLEAATRVDAGPAASVEQSGRLPAPNSLAMKPRPGNFTGATPTELASPRGGPHPRSGYGPERERR